MDDKRKYMRFGSFLDAQVSSDEYPSAGSARVINISRQGAAVEVDAHVPCAEHSVLKVKTYFPGGHLPIAFEGKVVWVRQKGAQRIAGLALHDMDSRNKSDLLDYAYKSWYAREFAH